MLKKIDEPYFSKAAFKLAKTSPYGRFRLGAIIVKKRKVLSMGVNQKKTHRLQKKFSRHDHLSPFLHAEIHAIALANPDDLRGADIHVARVLRSGASGSSRPCEGCLRALRHYGIRAMHYESGGAFFREIVV